MSNSKFFLLKLINNIYKTKKDRLKFLMINGGKIPLKFLYFLNFHIFVNFMQHSIQNLKIKKIKNAKV